MKDRGDLRHDHLYYLYFREKPDKNLTYNPTGGAASGLAEDGTSPLEETKAGGGPSAVSLILLSF